MDNPSNSAKYDAEITNSMRKKLVEINNTHVKVAKHWHKLKSLFDGQKYIEILEQRVEEDRHKLEEESARKIQNWWRRIFINRKLMGSSAMHDVDARQFVLTANSTITTAIEFDGQKFDEQENVQQHEDEEEEVSEISDKENLNTTFVIENKEEKSNVLEVTGRKDHEIYAEIMQNHGSKDREVEFNFGFGKSMKRMVRIMRTAIMVRVGGGWESLASFLNKHDPCRAKGRTNIELLPIISDVRPPGAIDCLEEFTQRKDPTIMVSSSTQMVEQLLRSSSVNQPGPIVKMREKTSRSVPMFRHSTS